MDNIDEILNNDEGYVTPPSNWFKFGKIGDSFKGTLVGKSERTNDKGEKQYIYEIDIKIGKFHNLESKTMNGQQVYIPVETPTVICPENNNTGLWNVGGKKIIDRVMRTAQIGQSVLMRYTADWQNPQTGYVSKTVETKLGDMDKDFIDTQKIKDDFSTPISDLS